MQEHHLPVTRSARYFVLGTPGEHNTQVWYVCHGYGQLADAFLRELQILNDGRRLLVAPEGLSRYYTHHRRREVGASWMTREDRLTEITDYVRYLDAVHTRTIKRLPPDARVVVLGFSQGAATVSRWVSFGRVRPDRLILWGELLPPDLDLDMAWGKLSDSRLTIVVGTQDDYVDLGNLRELEARLLDYEIPYETIRYDGGHHLDPEILGVLAAT
jgi:predicted esterase